MEDSTCDPGAKGTKREDKGSELQKTFWWSFCNSQGRVSRRLSEALNFSASLLSGSRCDNNQKRSLKTAIMGNVNLKYLIRICFLEKHEVGSVYERCWRVWHPCSLTPFVPDTSVIWFRNGWFARERQSGVGEGSVSECGQPGFGVSQS